jgi:hypothetical protein
MPTMSTRFEATRSRPHPLNRGNHFLKLLNPWAGVISAVVLTYYTIVTSNYVPKEAFDVFKESHYQERQATRDLLERIVKVEEKTLAASRQLENKANRIAAISSEPPKQDQSEPAKADSSGGLSFLLWIAVVGVILIAARVNRRALASQITNLIRAARAWFAHTNSAWPEPRAWLEWIAGRLQELAQRGRRGK